MIGDAEGMSVNDDQPFLKLDAEELDRFAQTHGFKRWRRRNWVRRTADFLQLVNLQRSQWSGEDHYLNFALWPLAMGEPSTIDESKFPFRARAEDLGAKDLTEFFTTANELATLEKLRTALFAGRVIGLVSQDLRLLLS